MKTRKRNYDGAPLNHKLKHPPSTINNVKTNSSNHTNKTDTHGAPAEHTMYTHRAQARF